MMLTQRLKDRTFATYAPSIHLSAADECETGVHKVLINEQKQKIESMETVAFSVAQPSAPIGTEQGNIWKYNITIDIITKLEQYELTSMSRG